MRAALLLTAAAATLAGLPAAAQQTDPSVSGYLCQFAGKCGGADETTATKAAPETKGFRLAAPQATAPAPRPARVVQSVPAARPARRVAAATAPASGTRADLRLNFDYNSDRMTPVAQDKARVFAEALRSPELQGKRFLIEGHTDSRGPRVVNVDLSRRRAQSVANFLLAQGVEPGRVQVRGVGPDQPLPGQAASAEANRRVEAVLLS